MLKSKKIVNREVNHWNPTHNKFFHMYYLIASTLHITIIFFSFNQSFTNLRLSTQILRKTSNIYVSNFLNITCCMAYTWKQSYYIVGSFTSCSYFLSFIFFGALVHLAHVASATLDLWIINTCYYVFCSIMVYFLYTHFCFR